MGPSPTHALLSAYWAIYGLVSCSPLIWSLLTVRPRRFLKHGIAWIFVFVFSFSSNLEQNFMRIDMCDRNSVTGIRHPIQGGWAWHMFLPAGGTYTRSESRQIYVFIYSHPRVTRWYLKLSVFLVWAWSTHISSQFIAQPSKRRNIFGRF
jgi:hypothetical protein